MDLNQTLNLVLQLQPTGQQQSSWYLAIGAIFGAALTGGLNILEDYWNRKRDRDDDRNKLIGQLKGQKGLTLQYYAFYFFSYISSEYLACLSTIEAIYAIDYRHIYSIPEGERNKEIMRIVNNAREESIEYKGCLKYNEELHKWKEELAKSNKKLLIIIASLQNYYSGNSAFSEFDKSSKQIEIAMDTYAQLEQTIKDEFNSITKDIIKKANQIPQDAYKEESKIDVTLKDRWATFGNKKIEILLPRIIKLQHAHYLSNIELAEGAQNEVKKKRESASTNLNDKIETLINQYQKRINRKWWQLWKATW